MVSKKLSSSETPAAPAPVRTRRTAATGRTAISSPRGGRARSHPLAPEHVGELGAVALLVMGIVGVALVITGLAVSVEGMTIAGSYTSSPPPNVAQLGMPQILGGIGVMVAGVAEIAAALLVLLERPSGRVAAVAVNAILAIVALAGAIAIFTVAGRDIVLTISLVIVAILLGLAAAVLLRRR